MPKGAFYAIYIKRHPAGTSKVATVGRDPSKPVDVQVAHGMMGHINEFDSCKSIKHLGYEIKQETMSTCRSCAEAKVKQKSLSSRVETSTKMMRVKEEVKTVKKRIHLDILTIKAATGICTTVTKLQWNPCAQSFTNGRKQAWHADWKLNIKFEYTTRDTPQQNSLATVGLATLSNRGKTMMIAANVPVEE
eukprot:2028146-Ditylum_brightwellii.AAC.1